MGKYFTIEELCESSTAKKYGIPNIPTKCHRCNMNYLIEVLLDPLRDKLGRPLNVSSGYRCEKLNAKVGGSRTSAHCTGLAADLTINGNNRIIYDTLISSGIPYDQVILEKGTPNNPQWVHVGISRTSNRMERLYYNGNTYIRL